MILISAFRHDGLRERFGDGVPVLGKPFDGAALLAAIAALAARSR